MEKKKFTFIINRNIFMMHFLINTNSPLWVLKKMDVWQGCNGEGKRQ